MQCLALFTHIVLHVTILERYEISYLYSSKDTSIGRVNDGVETATTSMLTGSDAAK